jgi:hypothetical protein
MHILFCIEVIEQIKLWKYCTDHPGGIHHQDYVDQQRKNKDKDTRQCDDNKKLTEKFLKFRENFFKFRQNFEGSGAKSFIRKGSFNVRKFTNV